MRGSLREPRKWFSGKPPGFAAPPIAGTNSSGGRRVRVPTPPRYRCADSLKKKNGHGTRRSGARRPKNPKGGKKGKSRKKGGGEKRKKKKKKKKGETRRRSSPTHFVGRAQEVRVWKRGKRREKGTHSQKSGKGGGGKRRQTAHITIR